MYTIHTPNAPLYTLNALMHLYILCMQHTYQTWGQAQTDWEEFWDESKNKYVYYNPVTKESSENKPVELLWGKEKQTYLDNKAEVEKEKWEKSELKRLQDRVAVLEMQNKELSNVKPGFMDRMKGRARKLSQKVLPGVLLDKLADDDEKDDEDGDSSDEAVEGETEQEAKLRKAVR